MNLDGGSLSFAATATGRKRRSSRRAARKQATSFKTSGGPDEPAAPSPQASPTRTRKTLDV